MIGEQKRRLKIRGTHAMNNNVAGTHTHAIICKSFIKAEENSLIPACFIIIIVVTTASSIRSSE